MVSKGNHPQMALFQVSELLQFAQTITSSVAMKGMRLHDDY